MELSATASDLSGPLDDDLAADLLKDVGLAGSDLAGPVWIAGTGLSFVHLPVVAGAVAGALPSTRPLRDYSERLAAWRTQDPVEG